MTENKRKSTIEEELKDKNYRWKSVKEWDSWEDLMRTIMPRTNCKWKDNGLSGLYADVWPEIWDYKLAHDFKNAFGAAP